MKAGEQSRVLLVDDDQSLVEVISMKLKHVGYKAEGATTSSKGYDLATNRLYDVIILDISMPGKSGLELCKEIRSKGILTPILILSGHTEKVSIVRGLELGADDYLTKPFSYNELSARLRALVRRNHKTFASNKVQKDGLELDVSSCQLSFTGKNILLTKKETLLLRRLMLESPEPVSRQELLKDVWGIDYLHTSNRLDVYIRRLRSKLAKLTDKDPIRTVRGSGYFFDTSY